MSEKIIELAKKVKALAEQGTAGEKAAAEGRLKFLMDKYGLTAEDIESETKNKAIFAYKNGQKWLVHQIIVNVLGKGADIYIMKGSHKNECHAYMTASEEIEIRAKIDHYVRAYERDLQTFHSAFIFRNELLPKDAGTMDRSKMSEKQKEEINRVLIMMDGVQKSEYRKQLEGKRHE
jgi:hypothetical protein